MISDPPPLVQGAALVAREALLLDEAQWDDWLSLYTEDCVFWVPSWRADGPLTSNPDREVSHIYVENKTGLTDRITRIHSAFAASSIPLQRTLRMLGASTLLDASSSEKVTLRTNWISHVYFPRRKDTELFFGHYEHDLVVCEGELKIARKKVVLKNDFIRTMMDFYFV